MTSPLPRRGRSLILVSAAAAALCAGAFLAPAPRATAQTPQPGAQSQPAGAQATPPPASDGTAPAKKAAAKSGAAGEKESGKDTTSYSLGVIMGEQLRAGGVEPDSVSPARIAAGVRDALTGKRTTTDADRQAMMSFLRSAQDSMVDRNHRAAARFLAENGKKADVVTTASGLQYKVMSAGSGESPKRSDSVTVNYRGTLLDGTEFDSSYKRHEPATFQVDRVIPGWTEALQLMKPGAKYELYVPPQLAYDQHSRPPIPPGSMLKFEVELLSVKPPAAPATPAQPAQPAQPAAPEGAAPKK